MSEQMNSSIVANKKIRPGIGVMVRLVIINFKFVYPSSVFGLISVLRIIDRV